MTAKPRFSLRFLLLTITLLGVTLAPISQLLLRVRQNASNVNRLRELDVNLNTKPSTLFGLQCTIISHAEVGGSDSLCETLAIIADEKVRHLVINDAVFSDIQYTNLVRNTELRSLQLHGVTSRAGDARPEIRCRRLRKLYIEGGNLDPMLVERLVSIRTITSVTFHSMDVPANVVDRLLELPALASVDVGDSSIAKNDVIRLLSHPTAYFCGVAGSDICDADVAAVSRKWQSLDLTRTNVGDTGVQALLGSDLRYCVLRRTQITSESLTNISAILPRRGDIPLSLRIDVSHTRVTGDAVCAFIVRHPEVQLAVSKEQVSEHCRGDEANVVIVTEQVSDDVRGPKNAGPNRDHSTFQQ